MAHPRNESIGGEGAGEVGERGAAWTRELEQGALPWIRPLRALPVVAELHAGAGLSFTGLQLPRFTSNGEVVVVARRHPTVQPPEQRRRDRLRWAWTEDRAVIEADPQADAPTRKYAFAVEVEVDGCEQPQRPKDT